MGRFTCPHCHQEVDIFSSGGTERTAGQFGLEFLGSLDLDPAIREGGDRGLPVALAGPESAAAKPFYDVARKVAARAQEIAASSEQIMEIS
jgi:ATP-binding protein involved in chromosome partitioning